MRRGEGSQEVVGVRFDQGALRRDLVVAQLRGIHALVGGQQPFDAVEDQQVGPLADGPHERGQRLLVRAAVELSTSRRHTSTGGFRSGLNSSMYTATMPSRRHTSAAADR